MKNKFETVTYYSDEYLPRIIEKWDDTGYDLISTITIKQEHTTYGDFGSHTSHAKILLVFKLRSTE